ncbi:hypothetical protein Gotur_029016 [Gossypium turneri]
MGTVSLSIFTSSSGPPIYIPTHNETPYEDPAIRAVILDEYFQNLNGWHVKVSLVNFAIVEMHQESTYGNCIWIGEDSGHTISKCRKIGMIIYLLENRSSF